MTGGFKGGVDRAFCFARASPPPVPPVSPPPVSPPVLLSDRAALGLGTLIPLLGCGEEAAALAFDGLASTSADPVASHALATIAAEERVHDRLLAQLTNRLPGAERRVGLMRAARRFHIQLGRGGATAHLGRIAAIDAAVCTVLGRLLRPGGALRADPAIAAIFVRIHKDEARHVRVSRTLALASMSRTELNNIAAASRTALAAILGLAGDSIEALGLDPDPLLAEVARLPDGLFAA